MAAAIMISTFGCTNGMTLAGARVYYAMAKDGLFFRSAGRVHPAYHTPAVSLMLQAVWAAILTVTGTYNELLDYVIFAVLLFYILTIAGIFRLRRTRPEVAPALSRLGLPCSAAAVYCLCIIRGIGLADPQSPAKFRRLNYRCDRHSGLLFLAKAG